MPTADELIDQLRAIRSSSEILAITCLPSQHMWRGVYNAACGMFPGHLLGLPHHYSQPLLLQRDYHRLAAAIRDLGFRRVVFTGYSAAQKELLKLLGEPGGPPCFVIYHSSFSQFSSRSRDLQHLKEIIELHRQGFVRRIAFTKKDMAEVLTRLLGIDACQVLNVVAVPEEALPPRAGLHVGVFTHEDFRKNYHNQVAAALLLPEAQVHVHDGTLFAYLGNAHRLNEHRFIESYNEFMNVLGSMTLNFYATFSECYGMVVAESLVRGVPCITSVSSGFFDWDKELGQHLVVDDVDDPRALCRKAEAVLQNRDRLSAWGRQYVVRLNEVARKQLADFLG